MTFDGDLVSLSPSIGNWQFPCRSHYWIRENAIVWAGSMTEAEIAAVRRRDAADLQRYFARRGPADDPSPAAADYARPPWWRRPWARRLNRT
jgi:hypothetical protein